MIKKKKEKLPMDSNGKDLNKEDLWCDFHLSRIFFCKFSIIMYNKRQRFTNISLI